MTLVLKKLVLYCWNWVVPPQKRRKKSDKDELDPERSHLQIVIRAARVGYRRLVTAKQSKSTIINLLFRSMSVPKYLGTSLNSQQVKFEMLSQLEHNHLNHGRSHPKTSQWASEHAHTEVARGRNRYSNVFPYDRTRVSLPILDGHSDYINASYVSIRLPESEKVETRYIATQGPLNNTVHHFWAMCYNESEKQGNDVVIIAMLTPTVESNMIKCSCYWPEIDGSEYDFSESLKADGSVLQLLSLKRIRTEYNHTGQFHCTVLELRQGTKLKTVYHIYYEGWADTRVPPSLAPLLEISKVISQLQATNTRGTDPIPIVHCSAGVGRTGTFIVLDTLLNLQNFHQIGLKQDGEHHYDPIFDLVDQLRNNRMMMVQTVHQYRFLYQATRDYYKATYFDGVRE
ncbi:uncharacterized protein KQ657_004587 [Scheffersomyces spartinae]|uniref:Uncharacterized protein n=1 Tax=Scheffersomyces spartinae TaxID=45513 RepID=A0A9P7VAU7_9ASCO|nr:uncharacterized protein KQ657_004587 [Scheffersomyces spartinae]KAG7194375.1 hypothetical protein KQ657_004587 [Scheffersomyces spartinae]